MEGLDKEKNVKLFLDDLHKIQRNAIYFMEEYWNKLHPENKLELTDEEKQMIYDKNRLLVPCFSDDDSLRRYMDKYDAAKKAGLKDWEIF